MRRRSSTLCASAVNRPVAPALDLSVGHHHVVVPYGPTFEEILQAGPDPVRVALLSLQGGTRDVRGHGVQGHLTPGVLRRSRLWVPDVAGIATEVPFFESVDQRVRLDDRSTGDVDEVSPALHAEERLPVEETLRLGRERSGDHDDVALGDHLVQGRVADAQREFFYGTETRAFVVEHPHVEGFQAGGDELSDLTGTVDANDLPLEVMRVRGDLAYAPAAFDDVFVGWQEIPDEHQYLHGGVLGDADGVGTGDLRDRNAPLGGLSQVHMVRPDPGREDELEVRCLTEHLAGDIDRPEGRRDEDFGIPQMLE